MTMPAHALYFGGYEAAKKCLQPSLSDDQKSSWVHFSAGFFADICGSIIWAPMDVIKGRVQMVQGNRSGFQNSFEAARSIIRSDGFLGLYRGAPVAIATFGPYVGLYFTFYANFKQRLARMDEEKGWKVPELPRSLFAAFCGASLAALLTCPIDVVKTNMQVYSIADGGSPNTLAAIKSLYRNGGLSSFLRGWNARILWLAPGSAVTMTAYEYCKHFVSFIAPSTPPEPPFPPSPSPP